MKPAMERLRESQFIKKRFGQNIIEELEAEAEKKASEKLKRDPVFVKQVIEQAITHPETIAKPVIDDEGYHIPTIIEAQKAKLVEARQAQQIERRQLEADPKIQERGRIVEAWMASLNIMGVLGKVVCPVCGSQSDNLVWKCHPETRLKDTEKLLKAKLEA